MIVYHAAHSLDANMIKSLLEQHHIPAFIQGEFLQGGMGELPAADLVKVSVAEKYQIQAEQLIDDWEKAEVVFNQS